MTKARVVAALLALLLGVPAVGQEGAKEGSTSSPAPEEGKVYKVKKLAPIPALPESAIVPQAPAAPRNERPLSTVAPAPPPAPPHNEPPAPLLPPRAPGAPPRPEPSSPAQGVVGRPAAPLHPSGELLTERLARRKLGSEGFQRLLETAEKAAARPADGKGAPSSSEVIDGARRRTGNDDGLRPSGTPTLSGSLPVVTPQSVDRAVEQNGSVPGGVVLEGVASGLDALDDVLYDRRLRGLILNSRVAYFIRVEPSEFTTLCRAIAAHDKEVIGVSLADKEHVVYGKLPKGSNVAWDLRLADQLLADMVFVYEGTEHWTAGYRFKNGYRPRPFRRELPYDTAVMFQFNGFQFRAEGEELQLTRANLDVQLIPISRTPAADGGFAPDTKALARSDMPQEWKQNARHLIDNVAYYSQERIVSRVFAYGETAALLRAMKKAGFDLTGLADAAEERRSR